mgnify:CR=1 FL=1
MISFRFIPLDHTLFQHYFKMDTNERLRHKAMLIKVDQKPGFPCRVSLEDAEIGEVVLALNFTYLNAASPYHSSGPIFVREGYHSKAYEVNKVPEMCFRRPQSLRAYSKDDIMLDATIAEGKDIYITIKHFFSQSEISYIHIHNAKPGCFNARIERVS